MALKWYIVHVYSGFENKVKVALEERIASSSHQEKFGEVLVPTEEIVELVKGKRKTSSRKFYPGYILVQMELDDGTWHVVNDTAKVTGFLGGRNKPAPISDEEADRILNRMKAGKLKPQPKYFLNPAMKFVSSMDLLRISTGRWKMSIMKRVKSRCL